LTLIHKSKESKKIQIIKPDQKHVAGRYEKKVKSKTFNDILEN